MLEQLGVRKRGRIAGGGPRVQFFENIDRIRRPDRRKSRRSRFHGMHQEIRNFDV
ncbi:hypothetical protein [Streptomyces sp. NPDC091209]|uniref:hypothetical protein n=1 Tax=Streptomyces sp. NPDC091209 TaxID=3365974 RepID=UPI00382D84D0